jgi:hypothetical protein
MPTAVAAIAGIAAATSRQGCPLPSNTRSLSRSHQVMKHSAEADHELWPAAQLNQFNA